MNEYLESLQLKSEQEVAVEVDELVNEVNSEEPAAEIEQAEEPAIFTEEVSSANENSVDEVAKEPAAEEVEAKPAEEELKPEPAKQLEQPVAKSEEGSDLKPGDVIAVKYIRIYKTPDVKQIAKNYAGNVTFLGKIGDFNIISYMRHGFGTVKGYTLDKLV